jgi:hypothetical protein
LPQAIKGKLVPYPSARPLSQIRIGLLFKAAQGINTFGAFTNTGKDGSFEMNGVPPVDYYVPAPEPIPDFGNSADTGEPADHYRQSGNRRPDTEAAPAGDDQGRSDDRW